MKSTSMGIARSHITLFLAVCILMLSSISSLIGLNVAHAGSGYPYDDATLINASTYTWGYTTCKGYCHRYVMVNGVKYFTHSERGYYLRNCTDYVAFKLESLGISSSLTRGRNNGKDWDDNLPSGVTKKNIPEVGDAAVWNNGNYGHVAYVEEVRAKMGGGYEARVSEYNKAGTGLYTADRWVSAESYVDFNGVGNALSGGVTQNLTGIGNIYAINRMDVGSNSTAVHVIKGSNWGEFVSNSGTGLPITDANWDFELADYNGDGVSDLWGFNRNPSGGNTMLHIKDGANWQHGLISGGIVLSGTDLNWDFELGYFNGDNVPDIYAFNRNGGSGNVQLTIINGANWGQKLQSGGIYVYNAHSGWRFAVGKHNNDGVSDIYAFDPNGGSGNVQLTVMDGTNWGSRLQYGGIFVYNMTSEWSFELGRYNNADLKPDIYAIVRNPSGGNTNVTVMDGTNWGSRLQYGGIVLTGTNSNWDFAIQP